MSVAGHGPCDWGPFDPVCCDSIPAEADRTPEQVVLFDRLYAVAREVLWRASGRRYGLCTQTIRPCREDCAGGGSRITYGAPWTPYLDGGVWKNCASGCGDCGDCRCCTAGCREVPLPGPVHAVTEVRIDGVALDPRDYRVDDHRMLVRTGLHEPIEDIFVDDGGVASLGDLRATGYDGVNVSGWLRNSWDTPPHTTQITAGRAGDTLTVLFAPGDTITWDNAAWESEDASTQAGSSVTIVGQSATGAGASPALRLRLVDGATTGSVTGTQGNLSSFGFSIVGGTSTVRSEPPCWPTCQDMSLPAGAEGTWEVDYQTGIPVGALGNYALSTYMCELWKLCNGERCALPARVEGVFRQGVNIDFADDNLDLLSGMRTGIPQVDTWLALVNPDRLRAPSRVYSPDIRRPRTQTWPE